MRIGNGWRSIIACVHSLHACSQSSSTSVLYMLWTSGTWGIITPSHGSHLTQKLCVALMLLKSPEETFLNGFNSSRADKSFPCHHTPGYEPNVCFRLISQDGFEMFLRNILMRNSYDTCPARKKSNWCRQSDSKKYLDSNISCNVLLCYFSIYVLL